MLRAFWHSAARTRILLLTGALLSVILLTVFAQLELNRWNVPFYNALERRSLPDFVKQLQVFFAIVAVLLVLNVGQSWLNQMMALSLREGLTNDLVDQWLRRKRAIRLASSSPFGVNPDQRLHEDARNLSDMSTSLSIGMVQATILLVSFVGVLWNTSGDLVLPIGGYRIAIPGYMVWAAVLYAGTASVLTSVVGRRLVGLNESRSAREADLRAILMRTSESLAVISIADGQERERRRIGERIVSLLRVFRELAWAQTRLTWVSSGFGWLAQIVPLVVAAPAYFSGALSFGGLMMAAGAFSQVNAALQWYVTNFGMISNWRATLMRVSTFRQALNEMDISASSKACIAYRVGEKSTFSINGFRATVDPQAAYSASLRLETDRLDIALGERVMIASSSVQEQRIFFHALSGDWPWGRGEVVYPESRDLRFVARAGQLPAGTLAELLCYPHAPADFGRDGLLDALQEVGLGRLQKALDTSSAWSQVLDREDQTRLAFASLLILRPRFIIFDDVFEDLDDDACDALTAFLERMADRTLIYVGQSELFRKVFDPQVVKLERTEETVAV
ncbi:ABC transporter ATP-binding protein/permease [Tianweitania populi]|uniref:ABC transporter permease n=1 Tax=Tianweitania populi TaxID=1607949 RepID=A0A8J3DNI6_9HYPH|nr:ABC transporter ATP-binding protein/permease [Tianweitania populi]GHD09985.1 ABC transporter permease [Tianweitania populi]